VYRDRDQIAKWRPDLIILDEAQRIKNWKTRTAKAVKDLESQYALVLTGTPLENRLEELYSIVEFVDRFRLGPMFRFLSEHQHLDEHGRVTGYRNLSKISETLAPILVRRIKEKVLKELPERLEKRFFVPMTPQQMTHHEENREIVARIVAKWRRYGFLSEVDQRRLQCALPNMRMSCNSTYLLDGETDHGIKADEFATLLAEILEDPEAKVVVFSQWVRMHELLARRLAARRWRRGAEPPERLGRGQHGPAVEPGRAGAADRPGPPPRPASPRAGGPFHLERNHRGGDARPPGVQAVSVHRRPGWRAGRSVPRRHASETVHGLGGEGGGFRA
jgi:hypothetical protein